MDPGKKISFGFSKQSKKPALLRQPSPPKVELVECLEGHAVKVKDAVEEVHEPLVIPIKEDRKGIVDRIKQARAKQSSEGNTKDELEGKPDSELTLDELAARELLNDAKKKLEQQNDPEGKVLVLPTKEDKLKLEGEPEPTLEDYENIPISDYGLAMLRGMGWKEGTGIGKKPVKTNLAKPPDVRPKGLGLGATRVIQEEKSKDKAVDKDGKELILKKGAFAKIIAGPNKGSYCKVLGLDDEAARVIVKTALKETVLSLNEFMVVLVSEEEYNRNSKVLNHAKYEEHKERIDNDLIKKEPDSVSDDLGNQTSNKQTSTSRSHSSYREDIKGTQSVKQEKEEKYKENQQEESKYKIEKTRNELSSPDRDLKKDSRNHRNVKEEHVKKEKHYSQDKSSSRKGKSRSRSRRDSSASSSDADDGYKEMSKSHKNKSKKKGSHDSDDDRRSSHSKKSKKKEKYRNDSSSDSESEKKRKQHKKKDKKSHKDRSRSPRRKHSKKSRNRTRSSSCDS